MRNSSILSLFVFVVSMVVLAGCKEPPTPEIEAARKALEEVKAAGVEAWAPEALRSAEQALSQVEAEAKVQGDKMGFLRNYEATLALVENAKAAAAKAKADADAAIEKAKTAAADSIVATEKALVDARALLAQAPTGKGTEADLEMMKGDLDGVEQALTEIKAMFGEQKYLEVPARAEAAKARAEAVKVSIEQAIAAVAVATN
jgi:hypothetical protein